MTDIPLTFDTQFAAPGSFHAWTPKGELAGTLLTNDGGYRIEAPSRVDHRRVTIGWEPELFKAQLHLVLYINGAI